MYSNNQKKTYNNIYNKISKIAEGASGKIIFCKCEGIPKLPNFEIDTENSNPNIQKTDQQLIKQDFPYVVLKKFKNESLKNDKGASQDTIREMKFMKQLDHPNVIRLVDHFIYKKQYAEHATYYQYIVMPFYLDLIGCQYKEFKIPEIKCIMKQILLGIQHLHSKYILHRDIKSQNIFVTKDGEVIIGDLGIAREHGSPMREMSGNVVTRYYRPPEILYGSRHYGEGLDIWSVGCTFAELFLDNEFLFPGISEIDQLQKIFMIRGSPNEQNWPECSKLPNFMEFGPHEPIPIQQRIDMPDEAAKLIEDMLSLDPRNRPSAEKLLEYDFIKDAPPIEKTNLPKLCSTWFNKKLELIFNQNKQF